jgi:hypothetical protein
MVSRIACQGVRGLYIDSENGKRLFRRRLTVTDPPTDAFRYADGMALKLQRDMIVVRDLIKLT